MLTPTYTIDTEGNSYFMGRDAVLYADGERVCRLALKDNRPAICVKVYSWGTDATKAIREELGEDVIEGICQSIIEDFWWHTGPEDVRQHHFEDISGAGRSGGWCTPTKKHTTRWWEDYSIDAEEPDVESTDELSPGMAERRWFFDCAVTLTAEVEHLRTEWFDELVRDAYAELESLRETAIVKGYN